MAQTRRTLLKTAGAAAVAAKLFKAEEARAAEFDPRSLTLCNLQGGKLGVKQGDRIVVVAGMSTDDVVAGRNVARLQKALAGKGPSIAEKDAKFAPCILAPQKIIMLGYNYRKHAIERGVPIPKAPLLFNKYNNALNAHGGTIALPAKVAKQFDYEVELQVIIGQTARDVSEADALGHVFGYATGNDFSARDLQYRDGKSSQFMIGKTPDGFMPVGPYLVGARLVPDPQKLRLECRVNGEQRQDSSTDDMIFTCAQIISYASQIFTLHPGDLISTGTPSGVILGMPPEKQVWLKAGDKVACSVEKLGELRFELT
jgi:2-keto-4-pentenoate hydratase/2-oxohepta-3-ene-1,7-dioic acid hydratase in catechol pathway